MTSVARTPPTHTLLLGAAACTLWARVRVRVRKEKEGWEERREPRCALGLDVEPVQAVLAHARE